VRVLCDFNYATDPAVLESRGARPGVMWWGWGRNIGSPSIRLTRTSNRMPYLFFRLAPQGAIFNAAKKARI
jgi:hypothetical protein